MEWWPRCLQDDFVQVWLLIVTDTVPLNTGILLQVRPTRRSWTTMDPGNPTIRHSPHHSNFNTNLPSTSFLPSFLVQGIT